MREITAEAKLREASPKAFRHSYASYLISEGVDAESVRGALGHASLALIDEVYGHHMPVRRHPIYDSMKA